MFNLKKMVTVLTSLFNYLLTTVSQNKLIHNDTTLSNNRDTANGFNDYFINIPKELLFCINIHLINSNINYYIKSLPLQKKCFAFNTISENDVLYMKTN